MNYLKVRMRSFRRKKMAVPFERVACNAKVDELQAFLNHYWDACNHAAKRLGEEVLRLKAGYMATADKATDEVRYFPRGLVLSRKDWEEKYIARARSSVN